MTTLTPSSQEDKQQMSNGCVEKIYRLSTAWFYIIGAASLLAWLLSLISGLRYIPLSIITNQILFQVSTQISPARVFSVNIVPMLGEILPLLISIQFLCFGYLGYKKVISAVIIGTALYFFDSAIHFLLGSSIPAVMNSPAVFGLIIGSIILISQKLSKNHTVTTSIKSETGTDRFIWAYIKVSSLLFVGIIFYLFLIFLVIP